MRSESRLDVDFSDARHSMEIARSNGEFIPALEIKPFHRAHENVDHLSISLHAPTCDHELRVAGNCVVFGEHALVDYKVYDACLVFERNERDATRGRRTLAADHEAGNGDARAVWRAR